MPLTLNTPPAAEPVTLAEAKLHLRVDTTDDDTLITRLIAATRARAEWHTGRAFVTQGWTLHLDAWPLDGVIELPLPPLQSVTSIVTTARDDTTTTLDPGLTIVDTASAPARIALAENTAPPTNLRAINGIAVTFTAGYGDASTVPAPIKEAILDLTAAMYTNRGDLPEELPFDALALLAPYRILKI
ncbi:MAG: phage head-tail connector protein [Alphaproteobacteria bacterium]|nr:phage head-tail connector protein [Alphaproteobacteria bacterium]MBL6938811.1 phage head-tail connector protein [Alphaproteobacteria bacterium]MBL7097832.1 phage head-tail connector protein [Alphaproteobacteria bacterium]